MNKNEKIFVLLRMLEIIQILMADDYVNIANAETSLKFLRNHSMIGKYLTFEDYLTLCATCKEFYNGIKKFLCFDIHDYQLYLLIKEQKDLFLLYNNEYDYVKRFLTIFGYAYGVINNEYIRDETSKYPEWLKEFYPYGSYKSAFLRITPLHASIANSRSVDYISLLLDHGADIYSVDVLYNSSISMTIFCEEYAILEYLLDNCNPILDESLMDTIVLCGDVAALKILLNHGLNPRIRKSGLSFKMTLFWLSRFPEMIELLLPYATYDDVRTLSSNVDDYIGVVIINRENHINDVKKSIMLISDHTQSFGNEILS